MTTEYVKLYYFLYACFGGLIGFGLGCLFGYCVFDERKKKNGGNGR